MKNYREKNCHNQEEHSKEGFNKIAYNKNSHQSDADGCFYLCISYALTILVFHK